MPGNDWYLNLPCLKVYNHETSLNLKLTLVGNALDTGAYYVVRSEGNQSFLLPFKGIIYCGANIVVIF